MPAHQQHHRTGHQVGNGRQQPDEERALDARRVLGDPLRALTWLVNELSGLGIGIESGQFVSTGTCAVPLDVRPGEAVTADYGALGAIGLRLGP